MAIFGIGKTKGKKVTKAPKKAVKAVKAESTAVPILSGSNSSAAVILRPRITEKSGLLSQSGVYTFEVYNSATKPGITAAVKALYKVTPMKVNIVNLPIKNVFVKGRWGSVAGVKKAVVTLRKGDKIDFV